MAITIRSSTRPTTPTANSKTSAQIVLNHVLNLIPGVESVVDVGCGTDVWLSVLKEKGVKTIQGYDGNWVLDAEALAIPRECFSAVDLNKSFEVDRRFDLAMSMEVAEHLVPESSANFVRSLTRLSDIVLFSAAVPGQGGTNHINFHPRQRPRSPTSMNCGGGKHWKEGMSTPPASMPGNR